MHDVVNVNLEIPELSIKVNLNLNQDDLLWDIKQIILNSIANGLKDGLNHDFYQPPTPFKAAKFLDSERMLKEYCLQDGCTLQMIAKKRIYKLVKMDKRKLSEVNSKASRKRLIQLVQLNSVKKVSKLLDRGIDPNFVETEKGECAMTIAAGLTEPSEMLYALVGRGAHLDLRNQRSLTALHVAASMESFKAIQTLLSLGASPNYKDKDALTPLYHCILTNRSAQCAETLLRDYALLGSVDEHGMTELHQASQLGKTSHIDLLTSYGADVNSRDLHGNTPLHLAVRNQQLESARMLLFRGADKDTCNLLNQTPLDLASFYNLPHMHQLISAHSPQDATPIKEPPAYNDKSRSTLRRRSHGSLATMKFKKLSLSSPYLHQSVSNLNCSVTGDVNPSVRSFESEENSTGSADQQFEFDLNNDSRPSSWTKASEMPPNPHISHSTTPTSSLRDLHTPLKIHNRSELIGAIIGRTIPEACDEADVVRPLSLNYKSLLSSDVNANRSQVTNNNYNHSMGINNYNIANNSNHNYNYIKSPNNNNKHNSILMSQLKRRAGSCENLKQDEYLNSAEIETLIKKKTSAVITKPIHPATNKTRDSMMNQHTNRDTHKTTFLQHPSSSSIPSPSSSPSKPHPSSSSVPPPHSFASSTNQHSDTYLNGSEVDQVLNRNSAGNQYHHHTITPSPQLLKPTTKQRPNHFEKPMTSNKNLPFQSGSTTVKSPTFTYIPPPPIFPKNISKSTSPLGPSKVTPFTNKRPPFKTPLPPFSPPLPPPPSEHTHTFDFPFPPPPPLPHRH